LKSQAHEGRKLIRARYDDGGNSGGSMERPALQKLLGDVRARRIDVVVVYKYICTTSTVTQRSSIQQLRLWEGSDHL
jgi:site-specific DNA recombinase